MIYTPNRHSAELLYQRYKDMPGNPMYRGEGGKEYFMKMLYDSVFIVEYPFGIVRFSDYTHGHSIRVHGLFHSKEVFRHTEDLRKLAMHIFHAFDVMRIEATIPVGKRALRGLLAKIGFEQKGTLCIDDKDGTIEELWYIRRK